MSRIRLRNRRIVVMLYDDDDHDLFLTPRASSYSATRGGASRHMIVNGRNQRIAIKIKCSNNSIYRVSPVYCALDPGQSVRLQIVRDAGQPGTDKIVVEYRASSCKNPRDAFKNIGDGPNDICKKVIGLVARDDSEVEDAPTRAPPPVPRGPPPYMQNNSAPRTFHAYRPNGRQQASNCRVPAPPTAALPPPTPPPPLPTSKPPGRRLPGRRSLSRSKRTKEARKFSP